MPPRMRCSCVRKSSGNSSTAPFDRLHVASSSPSAALFSVDIVVVFLSVIDVLLLSVIAIGAIVEFVFWSFTTAILGLLLSVVGTVDVRLRRLFADEFVPFSFVAIDLDLVVVVVVVVGIGPFSAIR